MLEETQFENRRNTNQTQRLRARLRASRVLGSMVSTIFSAQNGLFCWHHYVANLKITKKSAHLVAPTCKSVLGAANFVYVSYRNHHHHQHHIFVWNVNDCGDNTFKSGRVWGSIITHKLPQRRGGMRTEEWCSVVRAAGRVSRERRSGNNIVLCCNLVPCLRWYSSQWSNCRLRFKSPVREVSDVKQLRSSVVVLRRSERLRWQQRRAIDMRSAQHNLRFTLTVI